MLITPFGNIVLLLNGKEIKFQPKTLKKKTRLFDVDGRYSIELPIEIDDEYQIYVDLDTKTDIEIESGENLVLLSFCEKNIKLSIGTIGDIEGFEYEYLNNGITIRKKYNNISEIKLYISWISVKNIEAEEIFTWFASDPSLEE